MGIVIEVSKRSLWKVAKLCDIILDIYRKFKVLHVRGGYRKNRRDSKKTKLVSFRRM